MRVGAISSYVGCAPYALNSLYAPANYGCKLEPKSLGGSWQSSQLIGQALALTEVWAGRAYSYECDMWSLGVLLYEMMTYRVPFEANSLPELKAKIVAGSFARVDRARFP